MTDGIMGVGTIGEMGRSVMKATQGMSPEQKQEYFRQAAVNGIDPRVNNMALLQIMSMQLDRLQQPQAQMPQGGSIRQKLNAAVAAKNQQEQEAHLRAQINEALQRRAMEPEAAMGQGLGGLDAGSMERAEYAGGGIVAFGGGGPTKDPYGIGYDPTDPASIIQYLAKERQGGLGAFGAKKLGEMQALRKQLGIGEGGEYQKAMDEESARLEKEAASYGERMGKEDLAAFFFDAADRASRPGGTFLGSLAQAAPAYSARRKETLKGAAEAVNQAHTARLKLLQAKELEKKGDYDRALKMYDDGETDMINAGMKIYGAKKNLELAAAQKAPAGVDLIRYQAAQQMQKHANEPDSAEYKQAQRVYNSITPGIAAAQMRSANSVPKFLMEKYKGLLGAFKQLAMMPETYGPKVALKNQIDELEDHLKSSGYDIGEIRNAVAQEGGGGAAAAPAPSTGGALIYNPQTGKIEQRQ